MCKPCWIDSVGSAGLVEALPGVGPAWVSAGAQTLPCSLGPAQQAQPSRHTQWGAAASSCFAASVRPGLPELLLCYLNLSLPGDSFPPKQRQCACYRFQLITFAGSGPWALWEGTDCSAVLLLTPHWWLLCLVQHGGPAALECLPPAYQGAFLQSKIRGFSPSWRGL